MEELISIERRRYIGSKTKLADWIFEIITRETHDINSVADIFAGTGVIAKKMTSFYDKVVINDNLFSNNCIYEAFFGQGFWEKQKIDKKLNYYNSINTETLSENYFSINFGGKFFEAGLAKLIGFIRDDIEKSSTNLTKKEKEILITTLIYNIDKHANTVGHFEAYIKKNIKKVPFKLKSIDVQELPNIEIHREDANKLAEKLDIDLVYIDPPYNSRQYSRFYHVYETLVKWDKPILTGVALKPPTENMSAYCTTKAPVAFEDLIKKLNCKYLVVSYNNTYNSKSGSSMNKIKLEEIRNILNAKGETKEFSKDYRFFNAGKTNLENHKELLFITKVRKK